MEVSSLMVNYWLIGGGEYSYFLTVHYCTIYLWILSQVTVISESSLNNQHDHSFLKQHLSHIDPLFKKLIFLNSGRLQMGKFIFCLKNKCYSTRLF